MFIIEIQVDTDSAWTDSKEGPFNTREDATSFGEAECGVMWRVTEVESVDYE